MDLIPYSRQSIIKEDISMIEKVMESDFLTQGPKVPEFEEQLKNYFNVEYAVACSSGTSALHIAYAGIGINQKSLGIVLQSHLPPLQMPCVMRVQMFSFAMLNQKPD